MATAKRARIFLRRGTDADRQQTTLCEGELGYTVDGKRVYVGDNSTEGGVPLTSTWIVGSSFDLSTLNDATAAGKAEKGDFAVKTPATSVSISDINAHYTGSAVLTINNDFKNLYTLTDTSTMTWMSINSGIPISNIDIPEDSLSADQIHGGDFSGNISFSDSITANDSVYLLDVAANKPGGGTFISTETVLSAYPLGITSTGQVTALTSVNQFTGFVDQVNEQRNYFYDYLGSGPSTTGGTSNANALAAAIGSGQFNDAKVGSLLFVTNRGTAASGAGNGTGYMTTNYVTMFYLSGSDPQQSAHWFQTSTIYNNSNFTSLGQGGMGGMGGGFSYNQYQ